MKNEKTQLNRWYILVDMIVITLSYLLSWYLVIQERAVDGVGVLPTWMYFSALIIIVPYGIICNAFFLLYRPMRTERLLRDLRRIIESNLIIFLTLNTLLFLGNKNPYLFNYSRLLLVVFMFINITFELICRNFIKLFLQTIRKKNFNLKHILLVGYSDAAFKFIDRVNRNPGWGYVIHGIVDDIHKKGTNYRGIEIIETLNNLQQVIDNNTFDEIAITLSLSEYNKLRNVVAICEKSGVHTKFIPDYGTVIPTLPVTDDFDGLPVINIRAVPLQGLFNRFIKRTMDIFGSIFLIILFSPIMIIIAIIIKFTSKGPIIFKQQRVGRHNKIFTMYKFRSMVEQPDEEEKDKWTTENDTRVTKVGKIIRRISFFVS